MEVLNHFLAYLVHKLDYLLLQLLLLAVELSVNVSLEHAPGHELQLFPRALEGVIRLHKEKSIDWLQAKQSESDFQY